MKSFFYLIAGLLGLDGVLHLVKLVANPIEPNSTVAAVVTGLFGLAYLAIAVWMALRFEAALWPAVIVPLIGLLLTLLGRSPNSNGLTTAFIVLDILVIAGSLYLIVRGRAPIRRVR